MPCFYQISLLRLLNNSEIAIAINFKFYRSCFSHFSINSDLIMSFMSLLILFAYLSGFISRSKKKIKIYLSKTHFDFWYFVAVDVCGVILTMISSDFSLQRVSTVQAVFFKLPCSVLGTNSHHRHIESRLINLGNHEISFLIWCLLLQEISLARGSTFSLPCQHKQRVSNEQPKLTVMSARI